MKTYDISELIDFRGQPDGSVTIEPKRFDTVSAPKPALCPQCAQWYIPLLTHICPALRRSGDEHG